MVLNNKKAWLRLLEAFLGVMIIAGVILFVFANKPKENTNATYINHLQSSILEEIATNENLRIAVLSNKILLINETVSKKIPSNMGFDVKICELSQEIGCKLTYTEKETYTKDRIIATNITLYSPKKVRLTIWMN